MYVWLLYNLFLCNSVGVKNHQFGNIWECLNGFLKVPSLELGSTCRVRHLVTITPLEGLAVAGHLLVVIT